MAQSLKVQVTKSTVANLVAAFCVVAGMLYCVWIRNDSGVLALAGAGTGFLLKEIKQS